ncbi:unnamed protein product [Diatraea saccharalis]|uniref:Uncharacterized protein n=1 Tax=Diatraea saccharalis TaxID=40085 RepID=A0A9N9R8W2_9NEOP|nr:unnamed protein product [Diatraea saccharalis]
MMFYCGLLVLFLSSVRTGSLNDKGLANSKQFDGSVTYSYWPSIHNGARMMKIRKREAEQVGQNEGGGAKIDSTASYRASTAPHFAPNGGLQLHLLQANSSLPTNNMTVVSSDTKTPIMNDIQVPSKGSPANNETNTSTVLPTLNTTKINVTQTESLDKVDLSGPGVVKRGAIVFGGFALLAVAYFIFYRRKSNKNNPNNTHNAIDANQFRYGVLQSEDRRDNMELSHVPIMGAMESDDDEDDDLEIFDLEQRKKSLSYVNLQLHDDEIVNGLKEVSGENERDNLLLDIEDSNSDALINWSNNGNKSIL